MLLSNEKKGEEKSQEIERYLPCNLSVSELVVGFLKCGLRTLGLHCRLSHMSGLQF